MSHDFIRQLADNIREKDHRELIDKEHQLHRAKIVKEKGPALWNQFAKDLTEYLEALKRDLGNNSDDLTFGPNPSGSSRSFTIQKDELPCVRFTIAVSDSFSIQGSYQTQNPRCGGAPPSQVVQIEIKTDHQDNVHFEWEGKKLGPRELAEDILKRLFTV